MSLEVLQEKRRIDTDEGLPSAQSATVILDGTNVIGISNLGIANQAEEVIFYDVGFVFGSANDVYDGPGSNPVLPLLNEEDAFIAQKTVRDSPFVSITVVFIGYELGKFPQLNLR